MLTSWPVLLFLQANQILGLAPGEIFVQRNVGNQAMHTDLNLMSCLEYAVKSLKVSVCVVVLRVPAVAVTISAAGVARPKTMTLICLMCQIPGLKWQVVAGGDY
jgi:hypothetical protein